jgi:predicted nucleic acid-binding protein
VIAVDTNILVYAHRRDSEWHGPAVRTVTELAEGAAPWAIPWPELRKLLATARLTGPKVHDARIAAICLHAGVSELLSADRDFSRFPDLETRNPLIGAAPEGEPARDSEG